MNRQIYLMILSLLHQM